MTLHDKLQAIESELNDQFYERRDEVLALLLCLVAKQLVATTSNRDGMGERSLNCRMKKVRKMLARVQVYEDTLSETIESVRGSVAAVQKKLENALTS